VPGEREKEDDMTTVPGLISVRDIGAKGDGASDDTAAFQAALHAFSGLKGRTVIVPPGTYKLTATLHLEDVLLLGQSAGGWPADSNSGPVLVIAHDEPEAFVLGAGASVHGFEIDHVTDAQSTTLKLTRTGPSVTNLKIHKPWIGIACDTKPLEHNPGRLHVANVFMINVRHVGLDVQYTYDVPTIENVEVWISVENLRYQQTAFKFGHNDGLRASNLFAFGCACGYDFYTSEDGFGCWGALESCSTDLTEKAMHVRDASYLAISGGWHLVHHRGLVIDAPRARISINGGVISTNNGPAIEVEAVRQLSVTGLTCRRGQHNDFTLMDLRGAGALSISGCNLDVRAVGAGIRVGQGVRQGVITGNVLTLFNPRAPGAQPPVGIEAGPAVTGANAGTEPVDQPQPSLPDLFNAARQYAVRYQRSGAYPSYGDVTDNDRMASFGIILIEKAFAEAHRIPEADLEALIQGTGVGFDTVEGKFMSSNRWAVAQGFAGGFPTLHTEDGELELVCIAAGMAHHQDVDSAELAPGDGSLGAVELRMQQVDLWARENGGRLGFPNFEQVMIDGRIHYGAVLFGEDVGTRGSLAVEEI
jgi:hypothetical protein